MGKASVAERIIERMRERGLRLTYPRLRLITAMAQAKKPLSADEMYRKVANAVDRATVYRTLSKLEEAGCVSRFTFQNRHVYEVATMHSHYLVCKWCGKVERILSCTLDDIENASLRSSKKFASVDRHAFQLTGVCRECAH